MSRKKTVWFEVEEGESVEDCLNRMAAEGYLASGRKEEPLFAEVDGEYVPIRQLIKFKGTIME
jgi:hypothetical protein